MESYNPAVNGIYSPNTSFSKFLKFSLPILAIIIVIGALAFIVKSLPDAPKNTVVTTNEIVAPKPLSTYALNKSYTFPLKDNNGNDIGNFQYTIQNAQLQKQIIVQGHTATAVAGRIFLIFNLKIDNTLDKALQLNTRDYIRVILSDGTNEKLAPDIHNDPVEVQAISTKFSRLALAIDESLAHKNIKVEVGQIDGPKDTINLRFK